MAIQQTITDGDTQAVYADAYGIVDNIVVSDGITQLTVNWYVSAAAVSKGAKPVRSDKLVLPSTVLLVPNQAFVNGLQFAISTNAISTPLDALKSAMYLLVLQLPAYSGATFV